MDFRFIAAGILTGTIGFVGGSTVFADASHPADPTIASLAGERLSADVAASELPEPAKLPVLPKAPKIPVVPAAKKPRVVFIRVARRTTTNVTQRTSAPKQASHEKEHDNETSHEGGDD